MRSCWWVFWLLAACGPTLKPFPPSNATAQSASQWITVKAPLVNYYAVSGSGTNDIIAVGASGTIVRWNGKNLTSEQSNTTVNLRGVFAVSPTRAFAVGDNGTVLMWDGKVWSAAPALVTLPLSAVWADGQQAFAVGQSGTALGFINNSWVVVPTDSPDNLFAITGSSNQIFAVGTLGTVTSFNGTQFTRTALTGYPKTLAAATIGPGGTYLAGLDGALFNYGSGSPTSITGLPAVFLRGVATPASGEIFVAGWFGTLARVRGGKQLVYPPPANSWFYGIYAADQNNVWVVGTNGAILRGPPRVDPAPAAASGPSFGGP